MTERSEAVKQLRAAVAGNWDRVTDVFKAWDENGDGQGTWPDGLPVDGPTRSYSVMSSLGIDMSGVREQDGVIPSSPLSTGTPT